jgi:glyoxylase-like metal-dependent hydrolase (beta-lactamase superfamily II)
MHGALPASVRVIVRDWLSANHVLLLEPGANVLVDTGYVSRVQETLKLLREPMHLGEAALNLIVNTHCHSDHMGGNAALARAFGAHVAVPVGEAPLIDAWDTRRLLLDYADQRAERFTIDEMLRPSHSYQWGGLRWDAIAAPGHDMGALVFYCAAEGLLISGDALWENGFGILLANEQEALGATRATLETLAGLDVRLVIPGHGPPFVDYKGALERAFARLDALASDPQRAARSVLKALLSFTLLDRGRLPLSTLATYLDGVPIYREYNALYFGMSPQALADLLVSDLARAGAMHASGGFLRPGARREGL